MKKKVLGLLMAAVLCLGLLPAGVAADDDVTISPDGFDANGDLTTSSITRKGPVYNGSDTVSGQYYIVQGNVTVKGNLTVDGGNSGLILCAGATLTVEGALVHNDNKDFHIYGQTTESGSTGKLIINNNGDGAAIQSKATYGGSLVIHSGKLEINSTSGDLVKNVTLKVENTNKIQGDPYTVMKATRTDASGSEELKYEDWAGLTADKTELSGSKLVLEYCNHPDEYDSYVDNGDGTHHLKCDLCGFEWLKDNGAEDSEKPHTAFRYKDLDNTYHEKTCLECGAVIKEAHDLDSSGTTITGLTSDNRQHITGGCECGYGGTVKDHDYDESGECKVCHFTPVATTAVDVNGKDTGKLYDNIKEAIKNGESALWLVSYAKDDAGTPTNTLRKTLEIEEGVTLTLHMNGVKLEGIAGSPALTVSGGTLTVKDDANIVSPDVTAATEFSATPAIKVTSGSLIFEGAVTATGGKLGNSSVTSAIEVSGGKVTFEGEVKATAQKIDTTSDYTLAPAINVTGGMVTFGGDVTATGGYNKKGSNTAEQKPAIYAEGGELYFNGDLTLDGGLELTAVDILKTKLTKGTFTAQAGSQQGVKVGDTEVCLSLLADGYAFAKKDNTTALVDGYYYTVPSGVTIVTHGHEWQTVMNQTYRVCACGVTCSHIDTYENGVCTVCDYACPHPTNSVTNRSAGRENEWYCGACGMDMIVRIEVGGNTTYTTDLSDALNKAVDGTTITLLADVNKNGFVEIYGSDNAQKTVTLKLNGHGFDINSAINIARKSSDGPQTECYPAKLIIEGSGSITSPLLVHPKGELDLSGWTDGTINYLELYYYSTFSYSDEPALTVGTVGKPTGHIVKLDFSNWLVNMENGIAAIKHSKLNGGSYGRIHAQNYESISVVNIEGLLPDGYAFQHNTEEDQSFVTRADAKDSISNVKVVKCPHSGLTTDADGYGECAYCGTKGTFLAAVDGDTYDNWAEAFEKWLAEGNSTLKLYADYTASGDVVWNGGYGANVLDLNGHKMTVPTGYAFIPDNGMDLTIQDTSEKKNGTISSILDNGDFWKCRGLTLESGRIDSLTVQNCNPVSFVLKDGSVGSLEVKDYKTNGIMLKGGSLGAYSLPAGTVLADVVEHQYYAEGTRLENSADTANNGGSFAIKMAPSDFGPDVKAANVPYGGDVPFTLDAVDREEAGYYEPQWYVRTDTNVAAMPENKVTGVNAGKTLDVFCVITGKDGPSGGDLWQVALMGRTLTVVPADLSSDDVAIKITNTNDLVYSGQPLTPEVTVSYNGITLTAGTDYTVSGETSGTDAGDYTLTITGEGNYTGTKTATWTIKPHTLYMPAEGLKFTKPYDGTATVSTDNLKEDRVTFTSTAGIENINTVTLTKGTDFTISGEFDDNGNVNVGRHNAKITIALKPNGNYIFQTSKSYEAQITLPGEITKADAGTAKDYNLYVVNNLAREYLIDPAELLPTLPNGCTFGNISYGWSYDSALDTYYGSDFANGVGVKSENGKILLYLVVPAVGTDIQGPIGAIKVTVTTDNYEDIILTVNINATNKIIPTGAPTLSSDKLTYGEELSKITLSGAMKDGETTVPGTFAWVQPDTKPDAGEYTAEWKFTPKDTDKYLDITGTVTITVNKATPTGTPKYTSITAAGKTLADAKLTTEGGTFKIPGTMQWELPADTEVKANTAYKWIFTPAAGYADNYTTATGTITLYSVSTGGGGGGSTTTNTETTTNPDGSVTKTETKSDGTVIETTTNPDGSVSKTESKTTTKSDGSTVETVTETNTGADGSKSTSKTETTTAKDGSKTETKTETKTEADGTKSETKSEAKTDASGVTSGTETTKTTTPNGSTGTTTTTTENGNTRTEAETKVSEKAVEDAKKSGEAVKVPTEVKAGENSNSAPTVKVELPKNAGETKIEIPVSDVNSGTVAVIVHPDGTEEIVKDSKPTEDGVQLTVDGSATVKIIDNSKDFIDTRDHWSRDEVNFVASREIFNGVGNNLFGVGQPMTRGMVNTVLARLAGIDTTPSAGQKWYEVGTAWAKSQGITDGTNPEASVTREQLATLLYRFYGTPAVSGTLSFADAGEVSDYAQNALLWATQNGILNGVGNNRVAPSADAQRAQVAAMMARYLKNVG